MTAAKRLAFNVYATDPADGSTVFLKEGTKASDIDGPILDTLGSHLWEADGDGVTPPDAPAPPGGVTGQAPAAVNPDATPAAVDGAALIDGNVAAVMDRVGGDPTRARAALDAERAKGAKARTSLVAKLEAVASAS